MKKLLYLLILLSHASFAASDTAWISQLRTFRDAVYQRDKATAKQFFYFPTNNVPELWAGLDPHSYRPSPESPLTEKLFDSYFDQLFGKKFITAFLKVKTKDLYTKNTAESPDLSDDKIHFYKMVVEYDAMRRTIILRIDEHSEEKDENGEYLDNGGEFNIIYTFRLVAGQMKFESIMTAG